MTKQSLENGNYRWVVLGAIFLLQSTISAGTYSFGPLAPFLLEAFGISRVQLGLLNSFLFIAVVLFSVPTGWLVDRFGIRPLILLGAGAFGLSYALLSIVPNVGFAYIVVFFVGIGFAFMNPTTTMALVHWFTLRSRATAVSIKQSAVMVGAAAGAILIPSLSLWLDWRATVAIMGITVLAAAVFTFAIYRKPANQPSSWRAPAFSVFRQALANRMLLRLGLVGLMYTALQLSASTYLVLQLVEVRQMPVIVAGTFLMATTITGAIGRVLWGLISDRSFRGERRGVLVIMGAVSGSIAVVLSFAAATMSSWMLYLAVIALGASAFGWNGVVLAFATELSDEGSAATGLGWVLTILNIGGFLGPPLFGYIVDRTSSYNTAWLVFGILTMITALSVIFIRKPRSSASRTGLPSSSVN